MSKTATREIHRDDDYLVSDTHNGGDAATTIYNKSIDFYVSGVVPDLYIENTDTSESSLVATVTKHTITTDDDIAFDNGETFKIYKTGTKDSYISGTWCDVSRGWKIHSHDDVNKHGWRHEDWDIDDRGRKKVFGPGFPEKQ